MIKKVPQHVYLSWQRLLDNSSVFRSTVPEDNRLKPPQLATIQYLLSDPQPFLGPPNLSFSPFYLPQIVSFKSLGFTKEGLPEWYRRINDVSRGELERTYEEQRESGQWRPVEFNWRKIYSKLTEEEVIALASRYNFRLFLTYRDLTYPFEHIVEDEDYHLYELPEVIPK